MPSPVGHALAGVVVHASLARDERQLADWRRAAVLVAAALAPDLDLLFGFVDGRNHHQAESHSVGAAAIATLAAALLFRRLRLSAWPVLALGVGAAWLSHVFLDYLSRDVSPPIGLLVLWPFSEEHYKFGRPIFMSISRRFDWPSTANNLVAVAWELVLLLPVLAGVCGLRVRSRPLAPAEPPHPRR
jgi:membrane-bound metal-dependent hydrolase YbcI (DUF457 family)